MATFLLISKILIIGSIAGILLTILCAFLNNGDDR